MSVSFLNEERKRNYGRFAGGPNPAQVARCFHLNDADRAVIGERRGAYVRPGFASRLGTIRFLGTFLT